MKLFTRAEGRFAIEALAIVAAAAVPGYFNVSWKRVLALVIAVLVLSVLLEAMVALRGRRRRRAQGDAVRVQEPEPVEEIAPEPEQPVVPAPPVVVAPPPPPPPPPPPVPQAPPPRPPTPPQVQLPPRPVARPVQAPPVQTPPVQTPPVQRRPVAPPPPPPPRRAAARDPELDRIAAVFSPAGIPGPAPSRPAPTPASGPWTIAVLERALRAQQQPDQELVYMLGYLRDYAAPDGTLPPEFDELVREAFGPLLGRTAR